MKKRIRFLCFVLAMLMAVSVFFGCNKAETGDAQTSDSESETAGEPTLRINGVAIADYTVVYNSGSEKALSHFKNRLKQDYKIKVEGTTQFSDGYHLLIGIESSDSKIADFYATCEEGMIGFDGKNIFLLAKEDAGLYSVIDSFLGKATADGDDTVITVSENEKVTFTNESLTVMSYNVLYDKYYDDKQNKSRDINALANFIKTQAPDVFGTQETMDFHKEAILKVMPNYACYEGVVLKGGAEMSNMIFWNADKYKAVSKGFQYLTDTPFVESKIDESNSYRGFSYVVLESLATHKQFMVVDVHITYRGSDGEASGSTVRQARLKQAQYLVEFLENKKYETMPIILVGDFNSVPDSEALNAVDKSARMDRTATVAKTKGDLGGTTTRSEHTVRDKYLFDHIFVSSDRIVTEYFTAVDYKINDCGAQRYPSDHLAVLAKVVIY